jgi:hypothetical protein
MFGAGRLRAAPEFFVDAINGNDGNAGSAAAPFANPSALTWANSRKVALVRGSSWAAEISRSANSAVEITSSGTGALPILDGSDIITGWTAHATLANVWEKSVAHSAGTGTNRLTVYEDGALMARVTSAALCSSTETSFKDAKGSDGTPVTIQIHPTGSGNPNSNSKTYRVSTRLDGLHLGDNAVISGVRVQRVTSNNGALEVGENADVRKVLSVYGTKHNLLIRSGSLEDVIACRSDPATSYELSGSLFVGFTPDAAGKTLELRRCFAIRDGYGDSVGLIMHDSSAHSYSSFSGEQLASIGVVYGFDPSAYRVVVTGLFSKGAMSAIACYSDDATFDCVQVQAGSSDIGGAFNPIAGNSVFRVRNGVFYDTGSNDGLFRLTSALNGCTLELNNCIFYHSAFRSTMSNEGMTSGTIRVRNSIIAYPANGNPIIVPNGVTYEGDNNVFVPQGNVNMTYHGALKTTLAAWQSATGQDANSIVVAAANLAQLFSGTVANGDFRLGGAGAGAQAAALLAGPQSHWDWNRRAIASGPPTAWPLVPATLAESETYIDNPSAWAF